MHFQMLIITGQVGHSSLIVFRMSDAVNEMKSHDQTVESCFFRWVHETSLFICFFIKRSQLSITFLLFESREPNCVDKKQLDD